jgi:hypothetical protein
VRIVERSLLGSLFYKCNVGPCSIGSKNRRVFTQPRPDSDARRYRFGQRGTSKMKALDDRKPDALLDRFRGMCIWADVHFTQAAWLRVIVLGSVIGVVVWSVIGQL